MALSSCEDYSEPELFTKSYTLTVADASNRTRTSATLNGSISVPKSEYATEVGFLLSSSATMSDPKTYKVEPSGSSSMSISYDVTGLEAGKTYFYQVYCTGGLNKVISKDIRTFQTIAYEIPTVTEAEVLSVTDNSVVVKGKVLDNGGAQIVEVGFYYEPASEQVLPYIFSHQQTANCDISNLKSDGTFEMEITGLNGGTDYAIVAWAGNQEKRENGRSSIASFFTTDVVDLSVMSDAELTDVSMSSATITSTITHFGKEEILEKGIAISESIIEDLEADDVTMLASSAPDDLIISTFTGLKEETTYYTCAYVRTASGLTKGRTVPFKTLGKLNITPAGYQFPVMGETKEFVISTEAKATSITVKKVNDEGNMATWSFNESTNILTIVVGMNESEYLREAKFEITAIFEGNPEPDTKELEIKQDGNKSSFKISTNTLTFNCAEGTKTVDVEVENDTWKAIETSEWITLSQTEGSASATVSVTVAQNDLSEQRIDTIMFVPTRRKPQMLIVKQTKLEYTVNIVDNVSTMNFEASDEAKTFEIDAFDNWTIDKGENDWLTLSQSEGKNNATITVTPADNNDSEARSGKLIIAGEHGKSKTITVTQKGKVYTFDVKTGNKDFAEAGGSAEITVSTNDSWTVTSNYPDWLKTSTDGKTGDATITITAESNAGGVARTGKITIATVNSHKQEVIEFTQAGLDPTISTTSDTIYTVPATGDVYELDIQANTNWTAYEAYETPGFSIDKTEGLKDGKLTVTIDENLSASSIREYELRVVCGEKTQYFSFSQEKAPLVFSIDKTEATTSLFSQQEFNVQLTTNGGWSVQRDCDWIGFNSWEGTGSQVVTVYTYEAGDKTTSRTGTITFTSKVDSSKTLTITVNQVPKSSFNKNETEDKNLD